jgi:hypothetical protein
MSLSSILGNSVLKLSSLFLVGVQILLKSKHFAFTYQYWEILFRVLIWIHGFVPYVRVLRRF